MIYLHQITIEGRSLTIYLPPSYDRMNDHYPVVYVQDSGELFDNCINHLEHLYAQNLLTETIMVGIEPSNRNNEYTPWPAQALLEGRPAFAGEGRAYIDELADVLKPYIDEHYRTKPTNEHTAIIGCSFGGLISLFGAYWRPEIFGRIGLISASFWYEGVMDFLLEQGPPADHLRLFMSVGNCEGIYKTNLQKNMVQNSLQAYSMWVKNGIPSERLQLVIEDGGTHDVHHMTKQFPEALRWLFGDVGAVSTHDAMDEETIVVDSIPELSFEFPGTKQLIMHARRNGREYRIFVSSPASPPPEEGYPVLYALDGNASFASLTEAMRLFSRSPHGIEPAVVVSIGYDSNEPIATNQRFYDYTEQADSSELPPRPDGTAWPETGGADLFLAFIEEELKPAIERRFIIDRKRQALFGHSLGGLFVLHVLFTQPALFNTYIAGSPSIWWKNNSLLERWPQLEEKLQRSELDARLFIGIGSEEKPHMVRDAEQLYTQLLPFNEQGLQLSFRKFEGEGHLTVIPSLISSALTFFLRKDRAFTS
ncbi:MAG: alpha/beta hydrolase [Candidatus Pristimantibacillus sp.]